jgi:Cu-Zn family superoxide dismutase
MSNNNESQCLNAIAVFDEKCAKGTVKFHQCTPKSKTNVKINLKSLPPNKIFACHIHEFGDTTNGCKSLGGHWNPQNKQHGSRRFDGVNRHAGDMLNNLESDNFGEVNYVYDDDLIFLHGNLNVFGRSVVLHDGVDDEGRGNNAESKITGNAGGRMACAVIGVMSTKLKKNA